MLTVCNVFDKFLEKVIHSSLLCFNDGTVEDHVDDIFVKPLLINNFIWLLYSKSTLVFEKNMCKFSNYNFVLQKQYWCKE